MEYRLLFTLLAAAGALPGQDPNYYTTAEIVQEMDAQVAAHPGITAKIDLAQIPGGTKTHNGQSLWALKVSDNAAVEEDEPAMVLVAQHHARELNSTHMVVGALRRILAAYAVDPRFTALVDGYELYFVPCANPDGVDYVWSTNSNWRKNRRNNGNGTFGVDLNRNYPFLWSLCGGSTNPGSDTYRGPSPASEPEVQTLIALHRWLRPEISIDFHSFGREVLFLYAPCANVNPAIRAMASRYIDDLRGPMSYGTRAPSASGEGPHDHWATGGTMALLIEVGTSFQPAFSSTVTEEARVWPGVERALLNWRPTVSGHVRSILQGQPLEAQITYTPDLFNYTELNQSRARDGRYVMYLPTNQTYTITFSAPGHQSATRVVRSNAYDQDLRMDVDLVPNGIAASTLTTQGSNQIGTTTSLIYNSPGDAGAGYWVALSGGVEPAIAIGGRAIPLRADGLLLATAVPGGLPNNLGVLPASETVTVDLPIPPVPALVGLTVYSCGVTFDANYSFSVKKFSSAVAITVQ
jgi:hypothetical protein